MKTACERDFLEMSTAGKTRVLYLEQWKAAASARLLRLQHRLDVSVPQHVSNVVGLVGVLVCLYVILLFCWLVCFVCLFVGFVSLTI